MASSTPSDAVEVPMDFDDEDEAAPTQVGSGVLEAFASRLQAVKVPIEWNEDGSFVRVDLPNGRETRRVAFSARMASEVGSLEIEKFKFIGDFQAIWNPADDVIEAKLTRMHEFRPRSWHRGA